MENIFQQALDLVEDYIIIINKADEGAPCVEYINKSLKRFLKLPQDATIQLSQDCIKLDGGKLVAGGLITLKNITGQGRSMHILLNLRYNLYFSV